MYKRQLLALTLPILALMTYQLARPRLDVERVIAPQTLTVGERACLLYTSDAADERSSVDLGGRRIIKKTKKTKKKK